jgi:hypothetical protein
MKKIFILLLLLLLWRNNCALQCVSHSESIDFGASTLSRKKGYVDSLETTEEHNVCSMAFGMQYPQNQFIVTFNTPHVQIPGQINMDVSYKTKLILAENGNILNAASGYKLFYFTCNDKDSCDRQFWHDHIDWYVREESIILETRFRSILLDQYQEQGKDITLL